jgi:uncharacterized repeat protein (TIGR01451 family)
MNWKPFVTVMSVVLLFAACNNNPSPPADPKFSLKGEAIDGEFTGDAAVPFAKFTIKNSGGTASKYPDLLINLPASLPFDKVTTTPSSANYNCVATVMASGGQSVVCTPGFTGEPAAQAVTAQAIAGQAGSVEVTSWSFGAQNPPIIPSDSDDNSFSAELKGANVDPTGGVVTPIGPIVAFKKFNVALSKTVSQPLVAGGTGEFTIVATKTGPGAVAANALVVYDIVPLYPAVSVNATALASLNPAPWSCTLVPAASNNVKCVYVAAIPGGAVSLPLIKIPVNVSAMAEVNVPKRNCAYHKLLDTNLLDNRSCIEFTIQPGQKPNLKVEKKLITPAPLNYGGPATYQITATVSGGSMPPVVTITDTMNAVVFASATITAPAGWTCSTFPNFVCTFPTPLPVGTYTFTINAVLNPATVPPIPFVTNCAEGKSQSATGALFVDANPTDDRSCVTETPIQQPMEVKYDLSVRKEAKPAGPWTWGSTNSWVITINNAGPAASPSGLTVTDALPSFPYTAVSAAPAANCTTTGTWNVNCTLPSIPSGGGFTITITVTLNADLNNFPELCNKAELKADANDTNSSNNIANACVGTVKPVEVKYDLSVRKEAKPAGPWTWGSTNSWVITINNAGPAASPSGLTVTDALPSFPYTAVSAAPAANCTTTGTWNVNCILPSIPSGGSFTITITVILNADLNNFPELCNRAELKADANDTNSSNNIANACVGTVKPADGKLDIEKKADKQNYAPGDLATTVVVSGAPVSPTVTMTDTLNSSVFDTSLSTISAPAGWSCTGTYSCTYTAGNLPVGAYTFTIIAPIKNTTAPNFENCASVSQNSGGVINQNAQSCVTGTITPKNYDLSAQKSASAGPWVWGSTNTWTIVVSNAGPAASLAGLTVTDTLPAAVYTSVVATPAANCTVSGTWNVNCILPAIAPSSSFTITLTVTLSANLGNFPELCNRAQVNTDTLDTNPQNNFSNNACVGTVMPANGTLDIQKTSASMNYSPGDLASFTIIITVSGSPVAPTVTMIDTLNSAVFNISMAMITAPSGWTCTATFSCTYTAGNLPVGSYTFVITAPVNNTDLAQFQNCASVIQGTPAVVNQSDESCVVGNITPTGTDIAVNKVLENAPIILGQDAFYLLQVKNNGPAVAGPITITDTLSTSGAQITAMVLVPAGWTCGSTPTTTQTCNRIAGLGVGITETIIAKVQVGIPGTPPPTTVGNCLSLDNASALGDTNSTNNQSCVQNDVQRFDLFIRKIASPNFPFRFANPTNGMLSPAGAFDITVTHSSGNPVPTGHLITVTDQLAIGLTYDSFSGSGWNCSVVGQDVTCTTTGPLASSASLPVLRIFATVTGTAMDFPSDQQGSFVNNTANLSLTGDTNAANNTSTAQARITLP